MISLIRSKALFGLLALILFSSCTSKEMLKWYKKKERQAEVSRVNVNINSERKIFFVVQPNMKTEYIDFTAAIKDKIKKEAVQSSLKWSVASEKYVEKIFKDKDPVNALKSDSIFRSKISQAGFEEVIIISNVKDTTIITSEFGLKDAGPWAKGQFDNPTGLVGQGSVATISKTSSNGFFMDFYVYNEENKSEDYSEFSGDFSANNIHIDFEIFVAEYLKAIE